MATGLSSLIQIQPDLTNRRPVLAIRRYLPPPVRLISNPSSLFAGIASRPSFVLRFRRWKPRRVPRSLLLTPAASMFFKNPVVNDIFATALTGGIALSLLRFWGETAKRGLFDQAAVLAALIPGINIIKVLLLGLGIWKDEAMVKSMSRFGDYRELLKGPLYYASTITFACAIYWRTSPIAIAAICNLCAGDGLADIVGRRFGSQKIPYNSNKSIAGSIAMATAGFISSIGFMHYFTLFGYLKESWEMALGFLTVSLATALVESHPLSSELDDNLTVPLVSVLVGSFVF